MARSIDRAYERGKREQPIVLAAEIRAGLANGSMVRGETRRMARGHGMVPIQGDILVPARVSSVRPPLGRRQIALAWEVIAAPVVDDAGWQAVVVGIRRR